MGRRKAGRRPGRAWQSNRAIFSHTIFSHTIFSHTILSHTILSHIILSHTILSHTLFGSELNDLGCGPASRSRVSSPSTVRLKWDITSVIGVECRAQWPQHGEPDIDYVRVLLSS